MSGHMKVTAKKFSIKKIADGYRRDEANHSVTGLSNRLTIRPEYQREFVYDRTKADKVVDSVLRDYPINIMYWVQTGTNQAGEPLYEVLDGQQRLISLCEFITEGHTIIFDGNATSYRGLSDKSVIDNYSKLTVYVCEKGEGQTDAEFEREKLEWFDRINIAGMPLTNQELLSALKYGPWTTSAKSYFVHKIENGSTAYSYGKQNEHPANKYISAKGTEKNEADRIAEKGNADSWNRQEIFEKVLRWKTGNGLKLGTVGTDGDVAKYMESHRNDENASELWEYFKHVMDWVWLMFPTYHKSMQNVDWGLLYNVYHTNQNISAEITDKRAVELNTKFADEISTSSGGVYYFVLDECVRGKDADQSVLHVRQFDDKTAKHFYEKQHGICPACGKHFSFEKMQADHIIPWSKGGKTEDENCQMLCRDCNVKKSNDTNFGMLYSRDEVIKMSEEEIKKIEEGHLNSEQ